MDTMSKSSKSGGGIFHRLWTFAVIVFTGIVLAVIVRTVTVKPRSIHGPPCKTDDADFIPGNEQVLSNFRKALQFQTVSKGPNDYNQDELQKYQSFLIKAYPAIHSHPLVKWEQVANYSMLYTVQGRDPSLKPFMLTGHMDVVPIAEPHLWEAPPFSGEIRNGFIYGRGTIDDKHTVMGIMEAFEFLLKRGYTPKRPFYIGIGHDEEVGGHGALHIGKLLEERGVQLLYIMDEGLTIVQDVIPGIDAPVALVGASEKGYLTLRLKVNTTGGHSSMPRRDSSIGILANAVARLEANPHPNRFGEGPERGMFEHLAPEMKLPFRMLMANLWLFSPLVSRYLSTKPESNALVRTTTAVTEFHAGIKSNVIAPWAYATVNHRIHPAETVAQVMEYDRQIINDDRIQLEVMESREPLPRSPYDDSVFGYHTIKTSILQVWGKKNVVVAPSLTIGNTDTRHYTHLSENIYRFSPTFMYPEDLPRFHGTNERISIANYEEAVNFFLHLLLNSDKPKLEPLHQHGEF